MAQLNPIRFLRSAARNSPWVVIAVALHAVIIAAMSIVYLTSHAKEAKPTDTKVTLSEARKPEVVQPPEVIERKAPPKNEEAEIVDFEHEMQYVPSDEPEDLTQEVGDPTAESSGGASGGTAIGVGEGPGHFSSGKPSAFSTRRVGTGNKGRAAKGPTQGTEKGIREGLLWLARHQQSDGSWNATALASTCPSEKKCVAATDKYPEFWQQGLTGLSVLAFLGAGYNFDAKQTIVDTVVAKRYRLGDVVKSGLMWIKDRQLPDGSFGPNQHVYNQALCALALTEAYGLSQNRVWKEPAQKAIDWLVAAQKPHPSGRGGLWGWRYHSRVDIEAIKERLAPVKVELDAKKVTLDEQKAALDTKRAEIEAKKAALAPAAYEASMAEVQAEMNTLQASFKELEDATKEYNIGMRPYHAEIHDADLSVTTWVVMAFKSAQISGLKVPQEAFDGARDYVLSVSNSEGLAGYLNIDGAGQPIGGPGDEFNYHVATMSSLSILCRTFIDHDINDAFLEKAAKVIIKDLPDVSKDRLSIDYYYWYYGSLALNQFDGPDSPRKGNKYWDPWNKAMQDSVLGLQDDAEKQCSRGGYMSGDRWALSGSPIYSTAINTLTLEVYYRYPNAFGSGQRFEAKKTEPKKSVKAADPEPPTDGDK